MGYESLSSIVLVAIAALLAFVWAPRKARSGMKRASEHRADRFSPSLHLVDASSATRFNDATPPITKGLLMQAEQQRKASRLTPARIAHIRKMRRAAIRRRQILVSSLAAIAVVVLVLAFVLKFSPLFALIPVALMVIVLGFGAHASAQARAWEAEVTAMSKRGAGATQVLPQTVGPAAKVPASVGAGAGAKEGAKGKEAAKSDAVQIADEADSSVRSAEAAKSADVVDPATDIMPANEIQAALDRARAEQQSAKAKRADRAAAKAQSQSQSEHGENAADKAAQSKAADIATAEAADVAADAAQVAAAAAAVEPEDATNELARISPSHALDAFEMAVSQDLISFSLGASRSGKPVVQAEPESLEIKSTRQVAKAVPVEADPNGRTDQAEQSNQSEQTEPSAQADQAGQQGTSSHKSEVSDEVEAPDASSDSLGMDVDAVIARRGH